MRVEGEGPGERAVFCLCELLGNGKRWGFVGKVVGREGVRTISIQEDCVLARVSKSYSPEFFTILGKGWKSSVRTVRPPVPIARALGIDPEQAFLSLCGGGGLLYN